MQQLALASLGVLGNLLLIVDDLAVHRARPPRDPRVRDAARPAQHVDRARLLQTSVASSFGGFIRGQVLLGVVFGIFAAMHEHRLMGCPTARPPR